MEIVIKISDEDYKAIAKGYLPYGAIADAIKDGTPLPEHHGRLIDADALTEKAPEIQEYLDVLAPTIIEGSDAE